MSGDLRANGGGVQQCVAKALAAPLSPKSKILLSQRSLQFAEDFGTTVQRSELIQTIVDVASAQVIYIYKNYLLTTFYLLLLCGFSINRFT